MSLQSLLDFICRLRSALAICRQVAFIIICELVIAKWASEAACGEVFLKLVVAAAAQA